MSSSHIYFFGVPKSRRQREWAEEIFKEILIENLSEIKDSRSQMNLKYDKKKSTSRYIILKLQKTNDKSLKSSQEKNRLS